MSDTTHYHFPLIAESQSNKYLTHNDALAQIDTAIFSVTTGLVVPSPGLVYSDGVTLDDAGINPPLTFVSGTLSLTVPSAGLLYSTGSAFADATIDPTLTFASGTLSLTLSNPNAWTAAQRAPPSALSTSGTIAVDLLLSNNFSTTLSGNATLQNPSNANAGQSGVISIKQDATGSRTMAFGTNWKFAAGAVPVLTTAANALDVLSYYVADSTHIVVSAILNFA